MQKKVLIWTMTCGEGHNSIAKSIAQAIESQGGLVKLVDVLASDPKRLEKFNSSYLWSCKNIPHLYNAVWHMVKKINPKKLEDTMPVKSHKRFAPVMQKIVEEFNPDLIVCVHVEAGALLAWMKENNMISKHIKTVSVLHDFVLCPFWNTNRFLDHLLTPSHLADNELLKLGFKQTQLNCFGFPVKDEFYDQIEKQEARKRLGLENKFTFMSIAGGNNLGNAKKLLKQVLKTQGNYQVVMICSKNQKNKEILDKYVAKHNIKNVYVFGFVKSVGEVMSASDVVFSRGGCGVINEAFAKNLPIIFRRGLITNEKMQEKIFTKMGCGFSQKNNKELRKVCQNVLDNPKVLQECRKNITNFSSEHKNGAKRIARFLLNEQ